jgi:ribosomal protein S18 acetylase RimI-like enzyme
MRQLSWVGDAYRQPRTAIRHVIARRPFEDAEAIADVQVASWHAAYRGLMPAAILDGFTLEVRIARWKKNLASPDPRGRTTVLERSRSVVAFASHGASRDEEHSGEVWALYASPRAWGTGAGRALLDDGLAHLRASGFREIMLWVLDGNARAIRFYEAGGFRLDGGAKEDGGLPHVRMRRAR